ncbi:MAG TPA: IPT/TIG domain-containing protein, partial [Acidobacteriota bacterium]|nr:IPT/TIG domain-containing protein [Acidobacteriota bacterium]
GSFTITVTATDNCGATSTRTFVLNVNAYGKGPIIASFTPPSGPFGTSVTISGFNLGTVRQVIFNNQPATFTIDSNTQITATVPFGATTGPISVVSTTGTATSATPFTVIRTK